MVNVDSSSLQADSQNMSVGLAWWLAAIWHWVCNPQMNSHNGYSHDNGTVKLASVRKFSKYETERGFRDIWCQQTTANTLTWHTWSSPSHHPVSVFLRIWMSWPSCSGNCSELVASYGTMTVAISAITRHDMWVITTSSSSQQSAPYTITRNCITPAHM